MSERINAIVIGATGYVGGELLRLLAVHPAMSLHAAVSTSRAGVSIDTLYPALAAACGNQTFVASDDACNALERDAKVALFSAAPHGKSAAAVASMLADIEACGATGHAVDVSADFRFPDAAAYEAIYGTPHGAPALLKQFDSGVPEHVVATSKRHIGHPGCFATALLLASMPLVAEDLIEGDLFASGVTGSTGSGRSPGPGTHHPERHSNLYAYKPLVHRHFAEVERLIEAKSGRRATLNFVPHSGPFARGIYVTVQARVRRPLSASDALEACANFYAGSRFVSVSAATPRLKDVVLSNACRLGVTASGDVVCVTAAIDNLVKGAAGGAMQWMNRLWDLPEASGLDAPAPCWT